ncbi:CT847 family type III secretion system effector [Chlamydia vaughanii]|uniref:CT847 family type III secretion system effector n=1 Tax=Chlamydia vaughanii TaxID=3112552 RepID=UPI0032B1A79E
MNINPIALAKKVETVVPESTKVISDQIQINKPSAIYFCIAVMLQLSTSTTEFSKSIMAVLQDNTVAQQKKTKELINLPLLKVPDLQKVDDFDADKPEYKNQTEIQAFQSSNQQISANRQLIQQELSAAQQRAQANQKAVNSTSTTSMKLLQATTALLSSLKEYTIKANLTTSASD